MEKKFQIKPRPPSAPPTRQINKAKRRPNTAEYWKRNINDDIQKISDNRNDKSRCSTTNYNFFNLKILGESTQRNVYKGINYKRRKEKFGRKRAQSAKYTRPVTRMQMNRMNCNNNIKYKYRKFKRPQTTTAIRRPNNSSNSSGNNKNNIHAIRYEPHVNQHIKTTSSTKLNAQRLPKPTQILINDLHSAGLTEKMIEEDMHEREKPSFTQLSILLKRWINDDDINESAFNSFAVFCEYKLRKGLATTERYRGTNRLRAAITGMCIDRASREIRNYEGFLSAFADEYFKAVYLNWEELNLDLDRDGNPSDGVKMFNAKTYFSEYERIDNENRIYTLRINDFIRIQSDIIKEMNQRKMITSLGIVKRHFNTLTNLNKNSFRRSKQSDIAVKHAKEIVDGENPIRNDMEITQNSDSNTNINALADIIDNLHPSLLSDLVLDLGMNHSNYVSIEKVLSPLFNVMSPEERILFILAMSKSMSENEQQVWLETISTGKRDNGFRFILRKILNSEDFDKAIQLLRGEDEKQKGIDYSLLKAISSLKIKENRNNTELHSKFVKVICAMLYEDIENRKLIDNGVDDDGDDDENEMSNIIASGMSTRNNNSNNNKADVKTFPIEKIHSAIELKVQEIIRRRQVAEDERKLLKTQVLHLKQQIKKMENEMGEKAQLKNHMRKIDEYEALSASLKPEKKENTANLAMKNGTVEEINQPNLRKQGRARRQSFVGMLQDDAKETILLRHDDNFAERNGNILSKKSDLNSIADDLPLLSKPKETFSLVECNLIVTNIYQDKMISDSHCDKSCRQRSTLAEYTKHFFVRQHGNRSLAIQNSNMLHSALIQHSNENFRCRVFALLIGSVDPHSYLNRVEATDFFLRTLMVIFDINEKELFLNNQLPVSVKEMMGDGLYHENAKHTPCLIQQEKAAKVVRKMFTNNNVRINRYLGKRPIFPLIYKY
jgi:hypothetical protein